MQAEKKIPEDYPLIPMSEITDEARQLAKAWVSGLSVVYSIQEAHKLASDIMNYARRHYETQVIKNQQQWGKLTNREKQLMLLAEKGLLRKEMAYEMGVTFQTIKMHLKNIYAKIGVSNRMEAIKLLKSNNEATKLYPGV